MGGKHYAIVVGINHYLHKQISNLNYAERDALELYGAMCRAGFAHVDLITHFSHRLADNQVRVGSLCGYIDETIPSYKLNPDDVIWFFFAGHGKRTQDPNRQDFCEDYLLPSDAGATPGQTWIQVRRIVERLKETGSKNIILCLDACRDSDGRSLGDEALQGNYEGVITLFACDKHQKSYEIDDFEIRHGAFTYALLEAIEQKDRYPTIRELGNYLCKKVPELCRKYGKPAQTPVFQVEGDLQWQLPALPNVEPTANLPDLADLIQQARRARKAALNLIQNKYDDLEKLEIAKQKWWTVLEIDPTHAEARQEIEEVFQLITRCQLEDELRRHIENELKWQKPEPSLNKQTEPNQYFISAEPGAVIQFASPPPSGDSEPVPVEGSRAVEPPPAPPKPKPQPEPKPPDPFAGWELREWTFETVRVDRAGQIVERLRKTARSHFVDLGGGVQLELVAIPGGQFQMGSTDQELHHDNDESPVHPVTVPPLLVSRYPITVEQWRRVAGSFPAVLNPKLNADPSNWKDATGPVERVNWFDAMEFCARLSKATDRLYRLPTEAEWEYACRAETQTQTPFAFGETLTPELANYDGSETYADGPKGEWRRRTTSVGQFPPNGFGLQDMHGNVWEWCLDDWYDSYANAPNHSSARFKNDNHSQSLNSAIKLNNYQERFFQELVKVDNEQPKILRGGSWINDPWYCRSADRHGGRAGLIDSRIGFRVVVLP